MLNIFLLSIITGGLFFISKKINEDSTLFHFVNVVFFILIFVIGVYILLIILSILEIILNSIANGLIYIKNIPLLLFGKTEYQIYTTAEIINQEENNNSLKNYTNTYELFSTEEKNYLDSSIKLPSEEIKEKSSPINSKKSNKSHNNKQFSATVTCKLCATCLYWEGSRNFLNDYGPTTVTCDHKELSFCRNKKSQSYNQKWNCSHSCPYHSFIGRYQNYK